MSELSANWFDQAKILEVGQAIFLRVADKKEQTIVANDLEVERDLYSKVDPVHASQIFINKTTKNLKQYVVLERKYRAPFTAFFRDKNGSFSKLTIDPERKRIITLMLKAGRNKQDIEETLNGLTEFEDDHYFPNL